MLKRNSFLNEWQKYLNEQFQGIYTKIICIVTPWSNSMIEFLSNTQNFIFYQNYWNSKKCWKKENQDQESNLSIRQRWRRCEHHINKKICVCPTTTDLHFFRANMIEDPFCIFSMESASNFFFFLKIDGKYLFKTQNLIEIS